MRSAMAGTAFQLSAPSNVAISRVALADPGDDENEKPTSTGVMRVKPVSVELPVDDIDWADRYAEYRNALGDAEAEEANDGSKMPKKWSRKSVLEDLLGARIRRTQKLLEPITSELGPLPSDAAAMKKYAKRALQLVSKKST